jgi:hypothetical protein
VSNRFRWIILPPCLCSHGQRCGSAARTESLQEWRFSDSTPTVSYPEPATNPSVLTSPLSFSAAHLKPVALCFFSVSARTVRRLSSPRRFGLFHNCRRPAGHPSGSQACWHATCHGFDDLLGGCYACAYFAMATTTVRHSSTGSAKRKEVKANKHATLFSRQ